MLHTAALATLTADSAALRKSLEGNGHIGLIGRVERIEGLKNKLYGVAVSISVLSGIAWHLLSLGHR
ncbi:MAG TPA: hypothetical protein VM554_15535 [Acidisarcina sp.]|nr:hypothetical protein [Acidisarcina sp.]